MEMQVDVTRRPVKFLAVCYWSASMFTLVLDSKSLARNLFSLLGGPLRLQPDAAELAEASLLESSEASSINFRGIPIRCDMKELAFEAAAVFNMLAMAIRLRAGLALLPLSLVIELSREVAGSELGIDSPIACALMAAAIWLETPVFSFRPPLREVMLDPSPEGFALPVLGLLDKLVLGAFFWSRKSADKKLPSLLSDRSPLELERSSSCSLKRAASKLQLSRNLLTGCGGSLSTLSSLCSLSSLFPLLKANLLRLPFGICSS